MNDDNRTLGEVFSTVSIGTAFALESFAKIEKMPMDYWYFNIKTIIRNFYGSFKTGTIKKYSNSELHILFKQEIEEIISLVESINKKIKLIFYYTNATSLQKLFKHAKLVDPKESKPEYREIEQLLFSLIVDDNYNEDVLHIEKYDLLIKGNHRKAYITTSYPLDLLSFRNFLKLELLESHTGKIKTRSEWITKLGSSQNMDKYRNLPFNILIIQLIGDRNVWFHFKSHQYINLILELSTRNKWHSLTTMERVKYDINKIKDEPIRKTLIEMCNITLI